MVARAPFHSVTSSLALGLALFAGACSSSDKAGAAADSATIAAATANACPGDNAGLTLPAGFCARCSPTASCTAATSPSRPMATCTSRSREPAPRPRSRPPASQSRSEGRLGRRAARRQPRRHAPTSSRGWPARGTRASRSRTATCTWTRATASSAMRAPTRSSAHREGGSHRAGASRSTPGHRARNFAIGTDGTLYVNVGSATNAASRRTAQRVARRRSLHRAETRAPASGSSTRTRPNQRFSPAARFATGIRNGMGIAFGPSTASCTPRSTAAISCTPTGQGSSPTTKYRRRTRPRSCCR